MRLKILLPTHVQLDRDVDKVMAEGGHGWFTLLPRHIDFTAALKPGLLAYEVQGDESFLAVNGGTLVKCGQDVLVSTSMAASGALGDLKQTIHERFERLNEQERKARSALEKMQIDFVRRMIEGQRRA